MLFQKWVLANGLHRWMLQDRAKFKILARKRTHFTALQIYTTENWGSAERTSETC
jgi:hypothetical protein